MKRLFTLLLLTFQFALLTSQDWKLSVEPIFGLKNGNLGEFVYEKNANGSYFKESELKWDLKNIFLLGTNVEVGYKRFFVKTGFSAAIPRANGEMEDSDWLNPANRNIKTTYSVSDNDLISNYNFSILAKFDFHPFKKLTLAPTAEFQYKYISLEANNGEGWYGNEVSPMVPWNHPNAQYYKKGTLCGIDYEREYWLSFVGFELSFQPIQKIKLNGSFAISPFTHTLSYDTHWTNLQKTSGTDYADEIDSYFSRLKGSLGAFWVFNDRFETGISTSLFKGFEDKGKTYSKSHGNSSSYKRHSNAKGGISTFEFEIDLSCKIRIF